MLMQLARLLFWALVIYLIWKRVRTMMGQGAPTGPRFQAGPRPAEPSPPPAAEGMDSPYAVLGVSRGSTATEIRTAYQALVRKYHPDLVATMPVEFRDVAEKKTKEINAAYSQLKRWGVVS
ncbi:MAG: DnaJ family molecular chaperone [Myxococcota bacterium]|nr:J domain-containing protein [Myxococcota bacterium]